MNTLITLVQVLRNRNNRFRLILILWGKILSKKGKIFELIQGPLVAVVVGIHLSYSHQRHETLRNIS